MQKAAGPPAAFLFAPIFASPNDFFARHRARCAPLFRRFESPAKHLDNFPSFRTISLTP
jgi:hypothetical protein